MSNNKPFKVKNSIQAPAYYESLGTVETKTDSGWDILSSSYDSKYLGELADFAALMIAFEFKPDGTKLWILSNSAAELYEFDLSTPWDISTATHNGVSHSFQSDSGTDNSPYDIRFKSDGTKMFMYGSQNDAVYEMGMSPAWDITTLAQIDYLVLSEVNPQYLLLNADGTKMYTGGNNNDTIVERTLGNPWDLTGASITGSFVISEDATTTGIEFNRDGTKLFSSGYSNRSIFEYDLSTPYDIDTIAYNGVSISIESIMPALNFYQPYNIRFKPDGTKMYVIDNETKALYQFSTAKDIATLNTSTGSVFDVSITDQTEIRIEDRTTWDITATANSSTNWVLTGDHLNGDIKQLATLGSHIFIEVDDVLRITNNASSSHPFYIKYTQGAGTDDQVIGVTGNGGHSGAVIEWSPNEVGDFYYQCSSHNNMWGEIHVVPKGEDRRFQTRYGVEFAGKAGFSNEITGATQLRSIAVSSDGNHLYAVGEGQLRQYSLSTPYDITTKTYVQADGGGVEGSAQNRQAIVFSTDGDMYFVVHSNDVIHRIELSTPWDITTASYSNNSIDVANVTTEAFDFDISRDGKYMYVGEYTNKRIHKYYLTTPWDLTTAIRDPNYLNDAAISAGLRGVAVSNDGKHIIATDNNEFIWQFDPRVPYGSYNVSGARDLYGGVDLPNSYTAIRIQHSYNGEYIYVTSDAGSKFADQYRISGPVSDAEEVKSASVVLSKNGEKPGSFEIPSAYYANNSFDFSTTNDFPTDVFFKPDGTRMYMVGTGTQGEEISMYLLSTPWDISTATFSVSRDVSSDVAQATSIFFKPDGTKYYVTDATANQGVVEYTPGSAWAISGASRTGLVTLGSQIPGITCRSIAFDNNGTNYFIISNSTVYKISLSTAWDIDTPTGTWPQQTVDFTQYVGNDARSLVFSPNGKKLFIGRYPNVYQFDSSVAFNLEAFTYNGVFADLRDDDNNIGGSIVADSFRFNTDGTQLFSIGQFDDTLYEYRMKNDPSISYGSNIQWRSGLAPTAPETGETDVLTFTSQNNGLTYEGVLAIDGAK